MKFSTVRTPTNWRNPEGEPEHIRWMVDYRWWRKSARFRFGDCRGSRPLHILVSSFSRRPGHGYRRYGANQQRLGMAYGMAHQSICNSGCAVLHQSLVEKVSFAGDYKTNSFRQFSLRLAGRLP